jgi:hypothetical protein
MKSMVFGMMYVSSATARTFQVERHDRAGTLALLALPDHRHLHAGIFEERVGGVSGFIPTILENPPLVEALIGRQTPRCVAQMPLAEHRRGITGVRKEFRDAVFPGRHTVRAAAWRGNGMPVGKDEIGVLLAQKALARFKTHAAEALEAQREPIAVRLILQGSDR